MKRMSEAYEWGRPFGPIVTAVPVMRATGRLVALFDGCEDFAGRLPWRRNHQGFGMLPETIGGRRCVRQAGCS